MRHTTRWFTASLFLLALMLSACAGLSNLPPITIDFPAPTVTAPPPSPTPGVDAPVVVPEPAAEPIVLEPATPIAPLVDLLITVRNAATQPIPEAYCVINGERRRADGSGFIHFPVSGIVTATCAAPGYLLRQYTWPPGRQNADLEAIPAPPAPPSPPVVEAPPLPSPPPRGPFSGCAKDMNAGQIAGECLEQVAAASKDYPLCQDGDPVACHRYTREVTRALALANPQTGWGWGLITKFGGQGCTMKACSQGLLDEQKYGEDMVAWLPEGNSPRQWSGLDVVIGAGARGASHLRGDTNLPPARGSDRADNLWAPIP